MLVKLFFKQWQSKIKSSSPARRIFQLGLGYLDRLFLSLPLSSKQAQKGYIDHLFTAVSMVCVTGLLPSQWLDL